LIVINLFNIVYFLDFELILNLVMVACRMRDKTTDIKSIK